MKCKYWFFFYFVKLVYCDVSTLQQKKGPTRQLEPPDRDIPYGPYQPGPLQPNSDINGNNTSTSTFQLPEIIINKNAATNQQGRSFFTSSDGYIYERPNDIYLPPPPNAPPFFPPQADEIFINNDYLPPVSPLPPFADDFPSNNEYLPPQLPPLADAPEIDYLPPARKKTTNDILINFPKKKTILIGQSITKNVNEFTDGNGYNYPQPVYTTTTSTTTQQTPLNDDFFGGYVYNPPKQPQPPSSGYLPSTNAQTRFIKESDLFRNVAQSPLRLNLNELKCLPNQNGYFRSTIAVQSFIDVAPIVDVDSIDQQRCDIKLIRSQINVNIAAEDFKRCGVSECGPDLCLRVRFPQIRGMKSIGDAILTLKCKTQERIVAKTHALRFGVNNDNQARSAATTFAQGGSQQPFRTQVALFRKSDGSGSSFTRSIDPGGTVQLGEEMMLRIQTRAGDGWNHTRISDVTLQRLAPSGEVVNSAILITTNGCVNPSMRSVCPAAPIFEPPLGHRLGFRAVMFMGMRSGDEMVMSVRVVGCLERRDCNVDSVICERTSGRAKRSIGNNSINDDFASEISRISFRVIMPKSLISSPAATAASKPEKSSVPIWSVSIVGGLCALCAIALLAIQLNKHKRDGRLWGSA